jgi:mannosyltransferase PIG-V
MLQRRATAVLAIPIRAQLARLSGRERRVLAQWGMAHIAIALMCWATAWMKGRPSFYQALVGNYAQWDVNWYQGIAAHGYFSGRGPGPDSVAFFPGYPALLAGVHLVVRDWTVSGLLISAGAGAVALVCMTRLAGERAALYLILSPAAVYLMVGYSEALFLALALPAWMAALRRDWQAAALLAAFAGLTRVTGLFLIAALLLVAAARERGQRARALAWLCIAPAGPALYEVYLWAGTGSWTAWFTASRNGWNLHFVGPWTALRNTWGWAFGGLIAPQPAVMYQIEIAFMAVALALTLVLLRRRAWPEAVYCGLAVVTLGTTTYYQSVPRAVLLMWPLYMLIARAAIRRPWVGQVYLWLSIPLATLIGWYYFLGIQPA